MINSRIWIELATTATNINATTQISYRGHRWDVAFSPNKIRLNSLRKYAIDDTAPRDDEIEKRVNQITGHMRNLACFAFDINVKWGMDWGYVGTHVQDGDLPYPSIHQSGFSQTHSQESIGKDMGVLNDLAKNRKAFLPNMLNYWRRGYEQDKLGFDAEAFLNYFKILEIFNELGSSTSNANKIKQRFIPGGTSQTSLQRAFRARTPQELRILEKNIGFAAKVASAVGYDKNIRRGTMVFLVKCVYIRNWWNVGHKLLRKNPYDTYDSTGQHSDEFRLTMIENIFIEIITKYFILRYAKPGAYKLVPQGNMYFVEPA